MASSSATVKDRIEAAFLELLNEKPYAEITVTDIIRKAEVARVSYYRNYNSIPEIVEAISDKLSANFMSDLRPLFSAKNEREMRRFLFSYFYHFQEEYARLCPENKFNREIILSRLHDKVRRVEQENEIISVADSYGVAAKLGIIRSVAQKWGNDGFIETPEEMIDYVVSLLVLL